MSQHSNSGNDSETTDDNNFKPTFRQRNKSPSNTSGDESESDNASLLHNYTNPEEMGE